MNGIGLESGNVATVEGRTIPWLQDVPAQGVWAAWGAGYRDVVILDAENRPIGTYNLTEHDLSVPGNLTVLRDLLVQAAMAP